MLCSETALVGTKHFPKDLFSCSFSQGHPTTIFLYNICWGGGEGGQKSSRIFNKLLQLKEG